ncbi:hypothetical protein SAMN02982989_2471 [Xaviernesmea oryzae]|uniref:HEAT repeat domain-containing protein n=1 Tax=Xaviernesmea oryzae TaxID=464029 RepID=A0A1X7F894_9HYPH|nr:hypothetical protein [Xaviernesmea oryzae]SMF47808.1 hypothetical protein SAMN02982989_2471 [Xaviernesmea oryzae]
MANDDPGHDIGGNGNGADPQNPDPNGPGGGGGGGNGQGPGGGGGNGPGPGGGGIPPHLTSIAIGVGLLMIVGGVSAGFLDQKSLLTTLIACAGVAVVLSAFGAQAQGAWRGWTMGGSVAIAFAMFLLLQAYDTPPMLYKTGSISGDIDKLSDVVILDDDPLYQYRDLNAKEIKFILTNNGFRKSNIRIRVTTLDSGQPRSEFTMVAGAEGIAKAHLGPLFGNNKNIDWDFDLARRVVTENGKVVFKEVRSLQDLAIAIPQPGAAPVPFLRSLLLPAAFAQSLPLDIDPVIFDRLQDDDASIRRSTRDNLAALGPAAVPAMIRHLKEDQDDYRTKLGITYALAEMMRRSPTAETRQAISANLKGEDFPVLVAAAQDDDDTVRLQAGEFLYLLQDQRSIRPSIDAAATASDEIKAADQVLIIREAGKNLSSDEKLKVIESLNDLGAVNDLIKNKDALTRILKW